MPKVLFLICVLTGTLFPVLLWPGNPAQAQTASIPIPDVDLQAEVNTGINLEQNNNHAKAIEFYNAAVANKASRFGPFSQHLIHPLTGLARSYLALGEYEAAQSSIRYAQHLIHRFDGVLSLNQQEAIDLVTQIYLGQGLPKLANQQQVFNLSLAERNFAPGSLALLPALDKIASWYQETGQLNKAARSLQRSTRIIQTQTGDNKDARIIPYLVQQAKIKRLQRTCCDQNILLQAIAISASTINPDTADRTAVKARLYAELADAYTVANNHAQAEIFYKAAWRTMTNAQRNVQFSQPQKIAMSKKLGRLRSSVNVYQRRIDPLGRRVTENISYQDQLVLPSRPPQSFSLPLTQKNYSVSISSSYNPASTAQDYFEVVGKPFQFVKKQVEHILPNQWQSREKLSQLKIEVTFTVNKTGQLSNIQISDSNSPAKLNRLMQEVLRKTRMRPRMVAGEVVETHRVTLNQTFH